MTEISQELAQDLETLVREIAASNWQGHFAQRARAIVAEIEKQNDPDRAEALKITNEWYGEPGPHIDPILAALRHGKALGR